MNIPIEDLISKEEQFSLFKTYKETGDLNARNKLALSFMPLILREVSKRISPNDREDLCQECLISVLKGLNKFDPTRGLAFTTYLYSYILNPILAFYEKRREKPHHFYASHSSEDGRESCLESLSEPHASNLYSLENNPLDKIIEEDEHKNLHDTLHKLNSRTKAVIEARFGIGQPECTLEEIAKKFKLSRERVRQIQLQGMQYLMLSKDIEPIAKANGIKIKRYREFFNVGKDRFSKIIGVGMDTLKKWEMGIAYPPNSEHAFTRKDVYIKLMNIVNEWSSNPEKPHDWITPWENKPPSEKELPEEGSSQKPQTLDMIFRKMISGTIREEIAVLTASLRQELQKLEDRIHKLESKPQILKADLDKLSNNFKSSIEDLFKKV